MTSRSHGIVFPMVVASGCTESDGPAVKCRSSGGFATVERLTRDRTARFAQISSSNHVDA